VHVEPAEWPRGDQAPRKGRFLHEHENVEVVAILG
jgi:hypothetical protein